MFYPHLPFLFLNKKMFLKVKILKLLYNMNCSGLVQTLDQQRLHDVSEIILQMLSSCLKS